MRRCSTRRAHAACSDAIRSIFTLCWGLCACCCASRAPILRLTHPFASTVLLLAPASAADLRRWPQAHVSENLVVSLATQQLENLKALSFALALVINVLMLLSYGVSSPTHPRDDIATLQVCVCVLSVEGRGRGSGGWGGGGCGGSPLFADFSWSLVLVCNLLCGMLYRWLAAPPR